MNMSSFSLTLTSYFSCRSFSPLFSCFLLLFTRFQPCFPFPQPVTNNNPWMLLYFISFLLIVSFFVLNMFVGVVVENFHKCRQHQEVEEARRREEKRQRRIEKKRRSKTLGKTGWEPEGQRGRNKNDFKIVQNKEEKMVEVVQVLMQGMGWSKNEQKDYIEKWKLNVWCTVNRRMGIKSRILADT